MMKPRSKKLFAAPRQQRGAVIVLIVIAMLAMVAMAALAIDGSHMLVNKTRLQNAVDASALSGAKRLSQVQGLPNAPALARAAALDTLSRNASASGNKELAQAFSSNSGFATITLAASVYGPFSFDGPVGVSPRYVRVSVPSYPLAGFFWGILQALGGGAPSKGVAAIATAGPSPTSPCEVAPLLVCGDTAPGRHDPANGLYWGYRFGDLEVLKTSKNNTSGIGPGNFQLLDFGSGGSTVRDLLAGGGALCPNIGDNVATKPGNTVGPSVQGLNTRFGEYQGPGMSPDQYPPDLVTEYNKLANGKPALEPDLDNDTVTHTGSGGGLVSTDSSGNISTAGGKQLFDFNDWNSRSAGCIESPSGAGCQAGGVFERRMLKIVIGSCSGTDGGTASVPVLGFGCYFVLQPMEQQGGRAWLLGQFVRECEGDNVASPKPVDDAGPQIIQLYKTYIDNSRTPSTDS